MKRSERFTKTVLIVLALFSITAIILQIINNETSPIETAYEIITFGVAVTALILAVTQGIVNARMITELKKVINNTDKVLKVEQNDLEMDKLLARKVDKDIKIDENNAKALKNK